MPPATEPASKEARSQDACAFSQKDFVKFSTSQLAFHKRVTATLLIFTVNVWGPTCATSRRLSNSDGGSTTFCMGRGFTPVRDCRPLHFTMRRCLGLFGLGGVGRLVARRSGEDRFAGADVGRTAVPNRDSGGDEGEVNTSST